MFNVNGVLVDTIREVCEALGTKVSKKDVMAGKVEGVTLVDETVYQDVEETSEEIAEQELTEAGTMDEEMDMLAEAKAAIAANIPAPAKETIANTPPATVPESKSKVVNLPKKEAVGTVGIEPTENLDVLRGKLKQIYDKKVAENPSLGKKPKEEKPKYDLSITEYPEKGAFESAEELKQFYKRLSTPQLVEWAELEGATFVPNENEGIFRMRVAMAISNAYFPKAPAKSKKASKYSKYTTEELVDMCIQNEIAVKDDKGDMRILRMYAIMALREAGILE